MIESIGMATDLQSAYDYCQSVAKEHARNFYYAFRTLPAPKRQAIYAAYAYCRLCDDIADEEQPIDDKRRQFVETRALLDQFPQQQTHDPIFVALQDAITKYEIPREYLDQIIEGVEMDLTITRFQTFDDLYDYCYKVASVVGLICIEIFGYDDPKAREHAVNLGIAMQLTNILRDIKEDAGRDRIYLPMEDMQRFGYSESDLMNDVVNEQFRQLMRFQVDRARVYFASGKQLIPLLSAETRACPAALHRVYSGVLDRIESSGYKVFERRIGLSTAEKLFIVARLWATSKIPQMSLLHS